MYGVCAVEKDFFYLFDVGQGSCNLVKYHLSDERIIGILYDAGSSSSTKHPKLEQKRIEPDDLISSIPLTDHGSPPKIWESMYAFGSPQSPTSPLRGRTGIQSQSPDGARVSTMVQGNTSGLKESKTFIREKLEELDHLFVFLSHPDKDHMNWLSDIRTCLNGFV